MIKKIILPIGAYKNQWNVFHKGIATSRFVLKSIKSHQPNNLEKRFLVWSGKYKAVTDVPNHVSSDEMERCRNKVRIRLANVMILLTIIGCCITVYNGKQAAKRGESVSKQNLDWHKKYNEDKKRDE